MYLWAHGGQRGGFVGDGVRVVRKAAGTVCYVVSLKGAVNLIRSVEGAQEVGRAGGRGQGGGEGEGGGGKPSVQARRVSWVLPGWQGAEEGPWGPPGCPAPTAELHSGARVGPPSPCSLRLTVRALVWFCVSLL